MSIIVHQIPLEPNQQQEAAFEKARKKLGLKRGQIKTADLYNWSVDARRRPHIRLVVGVCFTLFDPALEQALAQKGLCVMPKEADFDRLPQGTAPLEAPPVVVGFGPAGMFAALLLAQKGYCPIVLERGGPVEERKQRVRAFWRGEALDLNCNVQFGEGGAGTFSDGKLTTRISDPACRFVLEQFVRFGAPQEILTKAKPHVGTDFLAGAVKALRLEVERLGGKVLFHTALTDLCVQNGRLVGVQTTNGQIPCSALLVGVGHSARDTFFMLSNYLEMTPKAFSVGVRIEQKQQVINRGLYGDPQLAALLGQGEYALSHRVGEDCVYTFCMCPGGVVVPAASGPEQVVTNGMSNFARDGQNANSALVVAVNQKTYGGDLFDGMRFQEQLEHTAYLAGGGQGKAPCATAASFLNAMGQSGDALQAGEGASVQPTFARGVQEADLTKIFPQSINAQLATGLLKFSQKLPGFATQDALLTGVETRTSSPLRISRGEDGQATRLEGVYPMGEGAGYAGGIVSAAVDGLHQAGRLIARYGPAKQVD